MSDSMTIIDEIRQFLTDRLPHRKVTGTWKDREQYHQKLREQGIHCVLYRGENPGDNAYQGSLKLLIYGLIELHARAEGHEVEQQELELVKELKAFSESDDGALLSIRNIVTSMQVEAPCGWYVAECDYGPVDLSVTDNRWDDGSDSPSDVYVGLEPEIGFGHEDDYIPMDELMESKDD
ncbi:hypothetical protein J7438_07105 [Thalassotalea sp. G20_0]|uniref:hypothetical protein n=1 Tax=Thalassotalea sp. G20_0 TaxID=2821093 RepID=UPI001ADB8F73|nr:hypothetical protein [Thalassotalea sp. G20_0]MBO9493853.1 hypothetical protein [Thalassotalea sp. G20_0]